MSYRDYSTAKGLIVDSTGHGDFTTVSAALAVAISGQTIFIRPGIYTENPTFVAGVNLAAYAADAVTPNVTIVGNCTFTAAGTVSCTGIRFKTNGNFCISVTGSAASILNLINCYILCSNNSGINYSSSSSSSSISLLYCFGNVTTTGITCFSMSSPGTLILYFCNLSNQGGSTTASTISAGLVGLSYNNLGIPITTSSTGAMSSHHNMYLVQNATVATIGGSGGWVSRYDSFSSGTASALSISTSAGIFSAEVDSSNTNTITGAGTLNYGVIEFTNTSKIINTTTQTNVNSGTFTPVLAFGGASVGITYSVQYGKYLRTGNIVNFSIAITLSSKGSSTGGAIITGLPFTSANDGAGYDFSMTILSITAATATYFFADLGANVSTIGLFFGVASTGSFTQLSNTNFNNGTVIRIQGFYFI